MFIHLKKKKKELKIYSSLNSATPRVLLNRNVFCCARKSQSCDGVNETRDVLRIKCEICDVVQVSVQRYTIFIPGNNLQV